MRILWQIIFHNIIFETTHPHHSWHEGSKDYKCESCGKSLSQRGNLRKHIHIVHEGHKDHK